MVEMKPTTCVLSPWHLSEVLVTSPLIARLAVRGDGLFDPVLPVVHVGVDAVRAILSAFKRPIAIACDADQDVLNVAGFSHVLVQLGVVGEVGPHSVRDEETAPTISTTRVLVLAAGVQRREMVRLCGFQLAGGELETCMGVRVGAASVRRGIEHRVGWMVGTYPTGSPQSRASRRYPR